MQKLTVIITIDLLYTMVNDDPFFDNMQKIGRTAWLRDEVFSEQP